MIYNHYLYGIIKTNINIMTKTQELRNKQLRSTLTNKLSFKLKGFKNSYLGEYADYQESKIENEIKWNRNLAENPEELRIHNQIILSKTRESSRRWFTSLTIESFLQTIKRLEYKLSFNNSNRFEWMSEANESYNLKFERLISKLVSFQIDTRVMKIESIGNDTSRDFGFLISDEKQEVHARGLYAWGEIKATHYRFIITNRVK